MNDVEGIIIGYLIGTGIGLVIGHILSLRYILKLTWRKSIKFWE